MLAETAVESMEDKDVESMQECFNPKDLPFDLKEYKVYLSNNNDARPVWLALKENSCTIGSKTDTLKNDIKFDINDFIGFKSNEVKERNCWVSAELIIFVKRKKWFRSLKRYIESYRIFCKISDQDGDSEGSMTLEEFNSMKNNFINAATNRRQDDESTSFPPLKLLIYFNPVAGSNSRKHFENTIDFIRNTNFSFDIVETKKKNHCLEHINEAFEKKNGKDISKYSGVVIISGDGLMHEFVNSKASSVIPVTHVPAGSANAFAKCQMNMAGEACEDYEAIFLAIKGRTKKFNTAVF